MKTFVRGASRVALLAGFAVGVPAFAQTTSTQTVATAVDQPPASQAKPSVDTVATQPPAEEPIERIQVTGSLIETAPEDAPKPVEVFTVDDLKEQGSPNITEFIRSLTSATPNGTGNALTSTGAGVLGNGFVSVDLRGQGANGTLVLMNGRRLASTNGGAGADVNTIPMGALQSVEVLKDGASSTYGAGAVGGVINFRTRRDIDAPQISIDKTFYDGNDGAYEINFLTGWVGDSSNLLVSLKHSGEDSLLATQRPFSNVSYDLNPAAWASTGLPQRFLKQTNFTTATPTNVTIGSGGGTVGASFNDFTSNTDCATLGGALVQDLQHGTGATTPTACAFPLANVTELVSEFKQDQIYAEFNANLSEHMEFHFDVSYSKYESTGRRPPSSGFAAVRIADSSISTSCVSSCTYIVPFSQNVYTTAGVATATSVVNPFVADFNNRQPGTTNDLAAGGALLTSSQWRPFMFGGNPLWSDGLARSEVQRERLLVNAGIKGEFAGDDLIGKLLGGIKYDFAGQFNQYIQTNVANGDLLADRLQDAIMGYGGPGCKAVDRVRTDYTSAASYNRTVGIQSDTAPGTNGCMWFNPFYSNFQTSIFNGAANPNFPAAGTSPTWGAGATQAANTGPTGFLNDPVLVDWLWATRRSEIQYQAGTFDAVFTGEIPDAVFALPGGNIGWALGTQWRQTERRGLVQEDDQKELALLLEKCPYGAVPQPALPGTIPPLTRGCAGDNGTGDFFSNTTPLQPNPGFNPPDYIDSQTFAYFGEVHLPVLDTVNLGASIRREEFNGGDVAGTIWGVDGKWDVTDNIYLRASYGTNFRAEGALDAVPGAVVQSVITDTTGTNRFGTSYQYLRITTTGNITPEDDKTMNIGLGYRGELFGGRLNASIDYFDIEVRDAEITTLATTVLSNVFHTDTQATNPLAGPNPETNTTNVGTTNYRADCGARLISFIQFNGGTCVQGTTTGNDIAAVLASDINGPGLTTRGIDYSIDYSHPLADGDLFLGFKLTQNLKYEAEPFSVNGVLFDAGGDRLGYRNNIQTGSASQELRGNASIRWANSEHSFGVRANYQDGYTPDPGTTYTPVVNLTGTANDVFSTYGVGKKDYVDYDLTYIYTAPFWNNLELRLSVLNITDRAPVADQSTNGFIAQLGDPRGRRIEVGFTQKF